MQRLKFQSKGRNLLALQGLLSNGEVLPLLILSKKDLPKKDDKNEEKKSIIYIKTPLFI